MAQNGENSKKPQLVYDDTWETDQYLRTALEEAVNAGVRSCRTLSRFAWDFSQIHQIFVHGGADYSTNYVGALEAVEVALTELLLVPNSGKRYNIYPEFESKEKIRNWLNSDRDGIFSVDKVMLMENDFAVRSLWEAFKFLRMQADHQESRLKSVESTVWEDVPANGSRIASRTQKLIYNLCKRWALYVDPDVRLPSRDSGKDNPLLRCIDAFLLDVIGDDRPTKDQVKLFVYSRVRPALKLKFQDEEYWCEHVGVTERLDVLEREAVKSGRVIRGVDFFVQKST